MLSLRGAKQVEKGECAKVTRTVMGTLVAS